MPPEKSWTIKSRNEFAYVRKQCALFACHFGCPHKREVELSIAITELLTNALKFGTKAHLTIQYLESPRRCLQITVADNGPGFDNVELALQDGYSEGRFLSEDDAIRDRHGLGYGLGAVKRLTDQMSICNASEGGARATIWKWLPDR
ncbi:MAG: ATP-binding protein [Deltaproteobacteria bacterium]|nr:ATP-binding protein [Deltaproteobacteria bacterium]